MSEHVSASAGKVVLSPIALTVMTLLLPIVGSMVKDRISLAAGGGTTETEITNIKTQLGSIQDTLKNDHVHRSEFSQLENEEDKKVGKDEFMLLSHDLDARLQQIQSSLDDLKRDNRFNRVTISPRQ